MKNRSKLEVIAQILDLVKFKPLQISHIRKQTHISNQYGGRIVPELVESGRLKSFEGYYRTSSKGYEFLEAYKRLTELLK